MNENKLISVIMGVYNGRSTLENAIKSILEQTCSDWEFIICDDASTDGSYEFLKNTYENDERFILIKNDSNLGLAATLNHCLEHCHGKFIARMDDDDICYSNRFQKQIDYLNTHPQISFVSSSIDLFDGEKKVGYRKLKENPTKIDLVWNSPFIHPATMFRAEDLKKVKGYRVAPETCRGQDYDLFMRMYGMGLKGANLIEPVYRFTVDENNFKRRTFKARIGEMKIRIKGYKAMKVTIWAFPFVIKPIIAYFVMKIRYKLGRRKY